MARKQAQALDRRSQKQHGRDWNAWLRGSQSVRIGRPTIPSKRAFRYQRGPSGWSRSPVGPVADEDLVPEEQDLVKDDDVPLPLVARLCLDDGKRTPLFEQASLETEANT